MNLNKVVKTNVKSKSNIGAKIQALLEKHNLSMTKVAAATGLTSEAIRQIVNGTIKNPGIETLSKIAEAFSISLYQLLEPTALTSYLDKKQVKVLDLFDLQKLESHEKLGELIDKSIRSTDILYIDINLTHNDFFAIEVNAHLADKLTNSGLPMLKKNDLLVFIKDHECHAGSIILAKHNTNTLMLSIVIEIEGNNVWAKSIDIPQKQIVANLKKENIIGIVHNVQFSN